MACDDSLIALRSLAKMFVIYAADIGTANRGGLNPDQNFGMARVRYRNSA
jgi:hypothetical protein